ncbi:MAG: hypothetical protein HN509_16575 [Halobacteriovoraceae bacterium]|jgi:hypothetical protein|nr:hypothetical protein [Halobacteriovoraceae bacterium]MBT5092816.1 hypothetical protein [Halobacteriovoraceae bacterium]
MNPASDKVNNDKLFNKVNYLLTQLRLKNKGVWEPLKREYDAADLDQVPAIYEKLVKAYQELN